MLGPDSFTWPIKPVIFFCFTLLNVCLTLTEKRRTCSRDYTWSRRPKIFIFWPFPEEKMSTPDWKPLGFESWRVTYCDLHFIKITLRAMVNIFWRWVRAEDAMALNITNHQGNANQNHNEILHHIVRAEDAMALNITNDYRNANQNYNEISPHIG